MITTLRTGALILAALEYKLTADKKLTIKLTALENHKLYGDVNIAITGADDIDIYLKDGSLVADYFNRTFKFTKTGATTLEYSEFIDRGVNLSDSFVSLGDVAVQATGTITITSYANLVSGTDDVITVGATGFTAQEGAATLGQATFQAATSNDATAASLAAQINAHATAGALVKATVEGAVITLTAIAAGVAGNSIDLTYTDNDTNVGATVSGTDLEDGAAGVEADIDNDFVDIAAGKYDFFLLDTEESVFSGATIGIKAIDVAKTGVAGIEAEFDEEAGETLASINGQSLQFSYPTRISLKDDDSGVTNIPLVING
jgi:hypothetical protein